MVIHFTLPDIIRNAGFFGALQQIVASLSTDSLASYPRLVGGCVRDMMLDKLANDIDLCTPLSPQEIITKLKAIDALAIPTGIKHGTITAVLNKYRFEITTLRQDIECDGRHATIKFTNNFKIDASRRDFTINALSYCINTEKLYDYFNGINDLNQHRVIFIGNPGQRITEDALRILRFFRFSAYYSDTIDHDGYTHCIANKQLLKQLSQERITSEVSKIILSHNACRVLRMMRPLLDYLNLSDIDLDSLQLSLSQANNLSLELRYAILLQFTDPSLLKRRLYQMKMSNKFTQHVVALVELLNACHNTNINIDYEYIILESIYKKRELFHDYIDICELSKNITYDNIIIFKNLYSTNIQYQLPVNGHDLMALGFAHKQIAEKMRILENIWVTSRFKVQKNELLSYVV